MNLFSTPEIPPPDYRRYMSEQVAAVETAVSNLPDGCPNVTRIILDRLIRDGKRRLAGKQLGRNEPGDILDFRSGMDTYPLYPLPESAIEACVYQKERPL